MAGIIRGALRGLGGGMETAGLLMLKESLEEQRQTKLAEINAKFQKEARTETFAHDERMLEKRGEQGKELVQYQINEQRRPAREAEEEIRKRIGESGTDEFGTPMMTPDDRERLRIETYRKHGITAAAAQLETGRRQERMHREGLTARERSDQLQRDTQLQIAKLGRDTQMAIASMGSSVVTDAKTGKIAVVDKSGKFKNWVTDKEGNPITGKTELPESVNAFVNVIRDRLKSLDKQEIDNPAMAPDQTKALQRQREQLNLQLITALSEKKLPKLNGGSDAADPTEHDIQVLRSNRSNPTAIRLFESKFGAGSARRFLGDDKDNENRGPVKGIVRPYVQE